MSEWQLETPVVFIIFNRPNTTKKVFQAIAQAKPRQLFVVADGPRPGRPDDIEKCIAARAVIDQIDWPCEVFTNYADTNLGCRQRVSSGLNWVFDKVEEAIILEDDCLPDQSFFRFCQELLEYYRQDTRIMVISGGNYQQGCQRGNYSYYFSQITHIWGWASWRRAWHAYQHSIDHFEEIVMNPTYCTFTHNNRANKMWLTQFTKTYYGEIDSWAYLWTFANLTNHGLTILPNTNLIQNIGFGEDATHTTSRRPVSSQSISLTKIQFPLTHPPYIVYDRDADDFTYREFFFLLPWVQKIYRGIKRRITRFIFERD